MLQRHSTTTSEGWYPVDETATTNGESVIGHGARWPISQGLADMTMGSSINAMPTEPAQTRYESTQADQHPSRLRDVQARRTSASIPPQHHAAETVYMQSTSLPPAYDHANPTRSNDQWGYYGTEAATNRAIPTDGVIGHGLDVPQYVLRNSVMSTEYVPDYNVTRPRQRWRDERSRSPGRQRDGQARYRPDRA